MAERWQQWYPHDIDSWQGSADIQALSDLAYRAVHNLLQDMWKQDDCALPTEDRELAKRSRVAGRWPECRDEVLDYFSDRTDAGKLTHRVMLRKWNEARHVYEKRQDAAKRTNASRSAHGNRDGDRKPGARKASRSADTHTGTGTETLQEQEPKQKPAPVATAPAFRLPDWISDESWGRFEEMRKRIRCPLSDGARHLIVKELGALQRLGHPPDEVLNQSVMRGWRGVFELKKEYRNGQTGNGSQTGRTNPAIERRAISRESIRSVAAERYGIGSVANDGRGSGGFPEPDLPPGHGQDVPQPVGADGAEVRDRPFSGRTLEGNPQK